jgi:hypothetical protein
MARYAPVILTLLLGAQALDIARAESFPCSPCAGVVVDDPLAALEALAAPPRLTPEAALYLAFDVEAGPAATPALAHAVAAAGAVPWLRLVFTTPAPLLEHLDDLRVELESVAALAASRPERALYQILWRPAGVAGEAPSPSEYAFLVKRASVAITGEDPAARVVAEPLPTDREWLRALYAEEAGAYLDALAFAPADATRWAAVRDLLAELDPGKPLVLDAATLPAPAARALPDAAKAAEDGFALALFRTAAPLDAAALAPLKVLANEFAGELTLDTGTRPAGGAGAWSFVRGEDLTLRVLVAPATDAAPLALRFPDPQLRAPERVRLDSGETEALFGIRRTATALEVEVTDPHPVVLLRVERMTIAELEGIAEALTIADERRIPVEEVLRRLQAFEDAQNRRIRHWQALNSTTFRFQAASGVQAVEATFEGEIFFRPGEPYDWAWQRFFLNGVRWRGRSIPEIPLVQPEKAAAMPLEISFTREYRYALRGTATVSGRDCWVVEFAPAVPVEGRTLFRGTVWVDRETSARVRTRAVQLGLQGEVLSNEETIDYSPVDAAGEPAAWSARSFVLPLRTVGQQILSVVNTTTVVEREVLLTNVAVNGPEFDARREQVLASEATMVRDTDAGLRYLVQEGAAPGERVVKEGYDTSKLFLLGGVLYDDSLDYPLPLAGINYFDLEFGGAKRQLNAFFGGVLGIVNYADPRLFGSKIDLGADLFALAISTSDQLYRDGRESVAEEIEERPARMTLNLGFPLGQFVKVGTSYRLAWTKYGRGDDTASEFVLPRDHLTQTLGVGVQFARSGYRLSARADRSRRSKWEAWGLPGNDEFDPDARTYTTWELAAAKNWYLPGFRKVGLELNWSDGENLDRFSKYQFGFFGGNRVRGYQIGKVRAERALAAHATYGFEIGNLLRLDAVGDAAWASDRTSGLDRELLAGVGLQGSFVGPWQTLVSIDIGTPVAGPDDGVVAYIVFLKLFD